MESMSRKAAGNPIQSAPKYRAQSYTENNIPGYDNGHSFRCRFLKELKDRTFSLIKKLLYGLKIVDIGVDIVKSVLKKSKPEKSVRVPIGDMFKKWSTECVNFRQECIPNTEDLEGTLIAKCKYYPNLSVAQEFLGKVIPVHF
jgi:hypothetical protein